MESRYHVITRSCDYLVLLSSGGRGKAAEMSLTPFHDDWTFRRAVDSEPIDVALPHDAMIEETRSADAPTGGHGGYFPGGHYRYTKVWTVPQDASDVRYTLLFEGVQGVVEVSLDGRVVAQNRNGYREFAVPLEGVAPGAEAFIEVAVDKTEVPSDRWYSGAGIYRPVWLERAGITRITRNGVRVSTIEGGTDASVEVLVDTEGSRSSDASVHVRFSRSGRIVAESQIAAPREGRVAGRVMIPAAEYWSAESPTLYDVEIALVDEEQAIDSNAFSTGLRTVEVDARRGLRINGKTVLLRGAAVHHDNGLLGAATFSGAEFRRAATLKRAGYNAIRSAHNPLSRSFLDACDQLGLYVMDELTDVWYGRKTIGDGSGRFLDEWRDDADSMIAKDRNRPSVIMYSIGNEIAESATADGAALAGEISAYVKAADTTRPTTLAVNPLLAMMAAKGAERKAAAKEDESAPERKAATSTAANMLTAKLGKLMVTASRLPAADKATKNAFAAVDIAGYNYAYASYPGARKRYPDRIILGTESMPGDLPGIWARVTSVPGVIGDFNWTGWDYLGEVGLGYWSYGTEPGGISKPYPGILAGAGVFDITGVPAAALDLAQAVWGVTPGPGIAVRPLDKHGLRANRTPWLASDAIRSWSWRGLTGRAEVEVYSDADAVELRLNGRRIGRKRVGAKSGFVARFTVAYEPGELTAIAFRGGQETGRTTLRSATEIDLRLRAEQSALANDELSFVWVELGDADGTVDSAAIDSVALEISGPGQLIGFGSADPRTYSSFGATEQATYRGRALAVIRRTSERGDITVSARSQHYGDKTLTLHADLEPMMRSAEEREHERA